MAKSRRGRGEGSLYQRANGLWVAAITLPSNGGKQRRVVVYAATKAEVLAKKAAREAKLAREGNLSTRTDRTTVGAYLSTWLEGKEVRPKTLAQYTWIVNDHLTPAIGAIRLAQLDVGALERFFAKLRKDGVGDRTRQLCYDVLRAALKRAVRSHGIAYNPLESIDRPRAERRVVDPWSRDEARLVLEAAKADRFYALYLLELRLGLQFPGEVLGLRWDRDVDLEAKKLRVGGQLATRGRVRVATKTDARRRELDLPDVLVAALRAHRAKMMADGLRASPWVFATGTGTAMNASNFVRDSFNPVVAAAGRLRCRSCGKPASIEDGDVVHRGCDAFVPGVRRIRPYDMRHTFATLALQANVHIKVVSRMLGHASVVETLRTYTHFLPSQLEDANEKIGAQLDDDPAV